MTTEYITVFITAPNEEEAAGISRTIVGERLAACVNIIRLCPFHIQMAGPRRRRARGLNDRKDKEDPF